MDSLFPGLSDDAILAKVACRAACLLKAAKIEAADQNQQYADFATAYMARPEVVAVLNDPANSEIKGEIMERIVKLIQDQFVYTPSAASISAAAAMRTKGYAEIPADIQTQRWGPDTCKCKLHQAVRQTADPVNPSQTFSIKPCPHHQAMSVAERHDAVKEENKRKNSFEAVMQANVFTTSHPDYRYRWSFDDQRRLVVDVSGLSPQIANAIRAIANRVEFVGKVIING